MPFGASSKGGGDYEPIPAGVHLAVCYSVVDLGSEYSDRYDKWNRKVVISWEIPSETIEVPLEGGGTETKPRVISKTYTNTIHTKANLRADLVSWRGKEFTPEEEEFFEYKKLIGVACQLNVTHKKSNDGTKTYATVLAVIPAPKGTKMKAENPVVLYCIEDHGTAMPASIPEWMKERIQKSPEYKELLGNGETAVTQGTDEPIPDDDDIPF